MRKKTSVSNDSQKQ